MPLSAGDLKLYQGAVVATTPTTANIGGAKGTLMAFSTVGELFFAQAANAAGGAAITQYSQGKASNDNTTFDLVTAGGQTAGVYMKNALTPILSAGTLSVVSDNAADNSTFQIQCGFLSSTLGAIDTLILNGTTPVAGALSADTGVLCWAQYQTASSGAPTASTGNITIKDHAANVLGIIPAGKKSATGMVFFWLPAALNTTDTIANSTTAPAGATWSNPSTPATALAIPTGTLPHTQYVTVWTRLIIPAGCPSIADLQTDFHVVGSG